MQRFLPGGRLFPVPDAVETQRRVSRAALQVISTGSTIRREGMATARTVAHANVDVAERVAGSDVSCAHEGVDERFDGAEAVSNRIEDRFLSTMLSTSQLTAHYAETFDDSIERTLRPEDAEPAPEAT
ncbi:hypothetical protein [Natronomonas marina]|jgi:hypothetical protein|uniref:hypothetical protein n=1 Tax=Natronomonas marina TaxID=2961939 RepID=UPI0020C980B3|nr:hypothetical protein [Natronomonas marina]